MTGGKIMLFKKKIIPVETVSLDFPYPGNGNKTVRVFVPEHKKGEKLPVIYMTDGQSVFDEESNPMGCWHTREEMESEKASTGKSAIIVGIHSDPNPMLRTAELTPASIGRFVPPPMPDNMPPQMPPEMPPEMLAQMPPEMLSQMPPQMPPEMSPEMMHKMMDDMMKDFAPAGEKFDDFVIKTVMPAVEKQFPVKKGGRNTAIIGSSSGGLEVFYIAMSHNDLFSAVGVLSPTFLFYAEDDIKNWVAKMLTKNCPFIYLYCGEGEPKEKQMCDAARPVFELIKEKAPKGKVKEVISPDGIHNESAWQSVFKDFIHAFLAE